MECGNGIRTRTIECHRVADNRLVDENFCINNISTPKPEAQESCKGCQCKGKWFYDEWGKVCICDNGMYCELQLVHSVKYLGATKKGHSTETFIAILKKSLLVTVLTLNATWQTSPLPSNHVTRQQGATQDGW